MLPTNDIISVGDWVRGTTIYGELVVGYVEAIEESYQTIKVKVISSDNEDIMEKSAELLLHKVSKLNTVQPVSEDELYDLIDLALVTNDKQWFLELTSELNNKTNVRSSNDSSYALSNYSEY
ncbi:IDEAL domain-containing protein [Marinococcus halophilus]|uniref:IDEAL domain-containing protein n=1 Tax=Marinococcus halophilus TaxID=1371 RepID=UPI0009A8430E|nr:IDEAL domain-containing protein [Marinococcus halophilus]